MKIDGAIGKGQAADDLVRSVAASPCSGQLAAVLAAGWLTDRWARFLSRLTRAERLAAEELIASAVGEFDPAEVIPEAVSTPARKAAVTAAGRLVLLTGEGWRALVETDAFSVLRRRHPGAEWRPGTRPGQPVVLLERGGFFSGRILGVAATVPVAEGGRRPAVMELGKGGGRYLTAAAFSGNARGKRDGVIGKRGVKK